jgi:periplasmic protein TonB
MKFWIAIAAFMCAGAVAQDAQEPRKIGPGVKAPVPIERPEPAYTEEAREAKLQGSVLLSVIIDADGRTKDIKVVRPIGLGLDEKAVEAVNTWKFEPARLQKDNTPVAVKANIEVNFRLN